ncbi:competence protein ComE, partial [Staphylococcus epidermidis]
GIEYEKIPFSANKIAEFLTKEC